MTLIEQIHHRCSLDADAGAEGDAVRVKLTGRHPPITTLMTPDLAEKFAVALNHAAAIARSKGE